MRGGLQQFHRGPRIHRHQLQERPGHLAEMGIDNHVEQAPFRPERVVMPNLPGPATRSNSDSGVFSNPSSQKRSREARMTSAAAEPLNRFR